MTLLDRLPHGVRLSPESFAARHLVLTRVLAAHVVVLLVWGVTKYFLDDGSAGGSMHHGMDMGGTTAAAADTTPHWLSLVLPLIPLAFAVAARFATGREAQYGLVSVGLLSASLVIIALAGGSIHSHIHFYAILVFVSLYQSWLPLLLAFLLVLLHHAVLGPIAPDLVFGAPMDALEAVRMGSLHAGLVLLELGGILIIWHFAEIAEAENEALHRTAEEARATRDDERRRTLEAERVQEQQRVAERERLHAEISAEVGRLRTSAAEVAQTVSDVDSRLSVLAQEVRQEAGRTREAATSARSGQAAADTAARQMSDLEGSISEIAEVNQLIATIAGQTNLLALNAAIEAARAGAAGAGFAVVASEVKQMADETAASAERVSGIVGAAVSGAGTVAAGFGATSRAVTDMREQQEQLATSVEEQARTLGEVAQTLGTAAGAAQDIFRSVDRLGTVVAS